MQCTFRLLTFPSVHGNNVVVQFINQLLFDVFPSSIIQTDQFTFSIEIMKWRNVIHYLLTRYGRERERNVLFIDALNPAGFQSPYG